MQPSARFREQLIDRLASHRAQPTGDPDMGGTPITDLSIRESSL
jgi:hypothetical protein